MIADAMEFKGEIVFDTAAADGQLNKTASNKKLLGKLPGFQCLLTF
jgi:GDP-L-fucose synthase